MDLENLLIDSINETKESRFGDFGFDTFGGVVSTNYGIEYSIAEEAKEILVIGKSPILVYSVVEYLTKIFDNIEEIEKVDNVDNIDEEEYAVILRMKELEVNHELVSMLAGAKLKIQKLMIDDIIPKILSMNNLDRYDLASVINGLYTLM